MTLSEERNINKKALAWTIGVHVVLLLIFFLWTYQLPITTPEPELGMEVNLGTSDNGSGTDQPMSTEDPAADQVNVAYKNAAHASSEAKDMMQSNDPNAPSVNISTATKNNNHGETLTNKSRRKSDEQQQSTDRITHQERPRYVYTGGSGKGGNSAMQNIPGSSEGITNGNGDMGVPGGTPGAANYKGSPGNGTGGISHTLTGRNIVAFPSKDASFHEGGTVVIRVTVNRDGNIVSRQIVSASSAELRSLALAKVAKVRFNKSETAPEEQFGNITFVFKTRS